MRLFSAEVQKALGRRSSLDCCAVHLVKEKYQERREKFFLDLGLVCAVLEGTKVQGKLDFGLGSWR
ncbi:MAG: hypothetical protein C5B49_11800 [Bdellovibrio sp.]|nr:MAG: hypothetical protein C5B49_11800 [Bdellovibrio sp.]